MVNDKYFFISSSYRSRLPQFARNLAFDTWLLLLICIFPTLPYTILTLWLLLHLNSETTSQHPISVIDSKRCGPHHSKSDCVNHVYYLFDIDSFQSLLFQYRQMYTKYSASHRFLWLLLHLNSETTSQHPISVIDSKRCGPHHSKSDCVNHVYYLFDIDSFQSLLFQYRQMYTKYSASHRFHFQELIYFLILLF